MIEPRMRLVYGHPSLAMHLRHFKTVTQLQLTNIIFQSFWVFRSFVVALPALSILRRDCVDLPHSDPFQRPDGRVPSLFSTPKNLSVTHTHRLKWNPLWIWVKPSQMRHRKPINPYQRPFLTPYDAEIIWRLGSTFEYNDFVPIGVFDWARNEANPERCRSILSDLCELHNINYYPGSLSYCAASREGTYGVRRMELTTMPLQQASFPFRPTPSLFTSVVYEVANLRGPKWDVVDALYDSLENLRALCIKFSSWLSDYHRRESKEDAVKRTADYLLLLRARKNFSLTFTIEEEIIPWETLIGAYFMRVRLLELWWNEHRRSLWSDRC